MYIGLNQDYLMTFDIGNGIILFLKAINSKTSEDIKSGIINNISIIYMKKWYQKQFNSLTTDFLKKNYK
jgi:hypothetical protein